MKKYFLKEQLSFLYTLQTISLTPEEDLQWYRFLKTLQGHEKELAVELSGMSQDAAKNGVVFNEDGRPDKDKSNNFALDKMEQKIQTVLNEEVETRLLDVIVLNKIKRENNIEGNDYFLMMERYMKEI